MACSSRPSPRPLERSFFFPAADVVAPRLLGKLIVRRTPTGEQRARVVETEAYTGALDPAAHAFRGLTPRTAVLYGEPGHAYVYFIYGMHWCLNVSTRPAGQAGGVLFRAAQVVGEAPAPLSGPGRLTRALAITGALNGCDLTRPGPLFLADDGCTPRSIAVTTRVGIRHARHLPYRFFVEGARAVTSPRSPILARLPPAAARPPFSGRPSAATPARQRTGGPSDGRAAAETRSAAIRAPAAQGASKLPR